MRKVEDANKGLEAQLRRRWWVIGVFGTLNVILYAIALVERLH